MSSFRYSINLDIIRIAAGVFVVMIHVSDSFITYPAFFGSLSWWIANGINTIGRPAVPLFIILSGYLILNKERDYTIQSFFSDKVIKISFLVTFWTVVYILWEIFWKQNYLTPLKIVFMYFGANNFHLYFLFITLGLYEITPFLWRINKKISRNSQKMLSIYLILFALIFNLFYYIFKFDPIILNAFTFFIPFIGYYYAGYFIKDFILNNKLRFILGSTVFLTYMASAILSFINFKFAKSGHILFFSKDGGQYFYDRLSITVFFVSLCLFLGIMSLNLSRFEKNKLTQKIIRILSSSILGIYLIHLIVLDLVDSLFHLRIDHVVSPIWFYLILKIVLVFFFSFVVVQAFKRIPTTRYLM